MLYALESFLLLPASLFRSHLVLNAGLQAAGRFRYFIAFGHAAVTRLDFFIRFVISLFAMWRRWSTSRVTSLEVTEGDLPTAPKRYSAGDSPTITSGSARSAQHSMRCTRRYTVVLWNANLSPTERNQPACSTRRVRTRALYLKKVYTQGLIPGTTTTITAAIATATLMLAPCRMPERVPSTSVESPV